MIKKMSKKEILQRLQKLDCAAPTDSPYIIFFTYLADGTVEAVEHYGVGVSPIKDRLYKSIKQVKKVFENQEDFDQHYSQMDLSNCHIIIDDFDLQDDD